MLTNYCSLHAHERNSLIFKEMGGILLKKIEIDCIIEWATSCIILKCLVLLRDPSMICWYCHCICEINGCKQNKSSAFSIYCLIDQIL